MNLLDEDGRLFGLVNVVDLVVVLAVIGIVAAGVGIAVSSPEGTRAVQETIVVETEPLPKYMRTEIRPGSVGIHGDVELDSVEAKGVSSVTCTITPKHGTVTCRNASETSLELVVTVSGTQSAGERVRFNGERLYLGRTIQIELPNTSFPATIVSLEGR